MLFVKQAVRVCVYLPTNLLEKTEVVTAIPLVGPVLSLAIRCLVLKQSSHT